ncbi:hypothetical protein ACVR0S_07800 [Streptococcus dentapri]|uniref:WXG100 family type VII secretion target n=1 Tax=Streptococcus dentapri TaxID=573564 RepID=A0ABV8D0Q4_9STRE
MAETETFPKVEDIGGLGDYAQQIYQFTDSYSTAANKTYRTYTTTFEENDQQGQVITAFMNKLNTMQSQLFDQFPVALDTYAQTVGDYEGALTGLGFQSRMWSKLSGAESLKQIYSAGGSQIEALNETITSLKSTFDTAAAVAEVEAPDLNAIKETATTDFSTAGTKRTTMASNVETAWTSFTSNLTSQAAVIQGFEQVINNARYMGEWSPKEVYAAIKRGDFTADEMYYIDAISSKEDGQALKAIMGEDPGKVTDINPDKVSKGLYDVAADEMTDWMEEGAKLGGENRYSKKYDKLFEALNKNDTDQNNKWFLNLLEAGDRRATLLMAEMTRIYDADPSQLNSEQMQALQTRLEAYNNYLGVFNSAAYLEVGSYTKEGKKTGPEQIYTSYHHDVALSNFSFDNNGRGISFDYANKSYSVQKADKKTGLPKGSEIGARIYENGDWTGDDPKRFHSGEVYDQVGAQVKSDSKEYAELQKARKKALDNYTKEVSKAIASGALTSLNPAAGLTFNVLSNMADGNLGAASSSAVGDPTAAKSLADSFDATVEYMNKVNEINMAEKASGSDPASGRNGYLDKGTWYLDDVTGKNSSTMAYSTDHYYDFNATLRLREMDTKGAVGYVESRGIDTKGQSTSEYIKETIYEAEKMKNRGKDPNLDSTVVAYLAGDPSVQLSDLDATQISNMEKYLGDLGSETSGEDYRDYLEDTYEYH